MSRRLRVLALAPYCDGTDVGEAWCAYQWVSHLAKRAEVTLLTLKRDRWVAPSAQLPHVTVVEWTEWRPTPGPDRLNSMLKPGYLDYWLNARRWIRQALKAGQKFDIAQQFTPIALRYPTPLAGFQIPYVLGPLGGSLDTPLGFAAECQQDAWYTRLRRLDSLRLKYDPLLRRSYAGAAAVLGVAPYVGDLLQPARPLRFEVISELGIDALAPRQRRDRKPGAPLELLHVGRGVRSKGLRDAVRALAHLPADFSVHLHSAGEGDEIALCRREASALGISDRVTFHGQIPREAVETLYRRADAFIFPSFREPSGSVIFEALRNGLPVITTDVGGPGFVVDSTCGINVPAHSPEQLAGDLAGAILSLAADPNQLATLGEGAHRRIAEIGLWENKIDWLLSLYEDIARAGSAGVLTPNEEVTQHA